MVDVNLVLNFLQAASIIVGVSIAILEIRNIGKARKLEALSQFSNMWSKREDMISHINAGRLEYDSYEEFIEKYSWNVDPEANADLQLMALKYTFTGKMVMDGIIDPEFVWDTLPNYYLISSWEKSKVLIDVWRERYNDPKYFYGYEYLYNITKKQFPDIRTRKQWLKQQLEPNS